MKAVIETLCDQPVPRSKFHMTEMPVAKNRGSATTQKKPRFYRP
jgi:hypothetical protein